SLYELLARGPLGISLVVASGHLLYVTIPKSVSNQTVHQTKVWDSTTDKLLKKCIVSFTFRFKLALPLTMKKGWKSRFLNRFVNVLHTVEKVIEVVPRFYLCPCVYSIACNGEISFLTI